MSVNFEYVIGTIGDLGAAERWSKNLTADQKDLAAAVTAAFRAGGELAKFRGRTNIAEAGFSKKWQNALRVDVFPSGGKDSLRPAIVMHHKIPYAGVFEEGAEIKGTQGKGGFMWLPVEGLVKRFGKGGERITPQSFERATGQKLIEFQAPDGTPVLAVRIKVKKTGVTKLSLTRLRRGEDGKVGVTETVPVFVGIRIVHIPKKLDLHGVMEGVESELPGLIQRNSGTI